jgi:hypothetical protein
MDDKTMHHARSIVAVITHASHAIHTHISPYLTMSCLSSAVMFFFIFDSAIRGQNRPLFSYLRAKQIGSGSVAIRASC